MNGVYATVAAPTPVAADIRHHPTDAWLMQLAAGTLPDGMRLATEVHVELCASCREKMRLHLALGGVLLDQLPPSAMRDGALARTFERIDRPHAAVDARPARRRIAAPHPPLPPGTEWPRALGDCVATRWRWLGPGMRWSRVAVPGAPDANVFLLRIGAGKYLPQHTHAGSELTQVLFGRFHDGRALYGPGDFDLVDDAVHHQPVVQEGSECICIAAIDGRLRFDGLIARWFGDRVGM